MIGHTRTIQSVVRGRVCPPRLLSARPGEDDLLLGLRLATTHPSYAAHALGDPNAMDSMCSEYLDALTSGPERYRESWWGIGHLEQKLYRRVVKDSQARWAPEPRYEDVPGISTGNGTWPRAERRRLGTYDKAYGVTISPAFEYLIGGDGKNVPIWEDLRFTRRPDKVFEAAARNSLIPSVYEIGTEPGRIYYSKANKEVSFPDTVAAYLRRHVCPEHLKKLMGGRYPNGPKEWMIVYWRLHRW